MSTLASGGFLPRWFPIPGIRFEVAESAGAAPAPAPAADESAVGAGGQYDGAPAPTETPAAETPETPEPAADLSANLTPEMREYLTREAEAIADARFQQLQQQPGEEYVEQQPGEFELDLFADDGGQQLASLIQQNNQSLLQQVQQVVAPLIQAQEQQVAAESQELVRDALAAIDVGGDFNRDHAARLFDLYKGEAVQRYGVSNRALEYAAERAAREVRGIEQAAEERAVERYKNELAAVGGASRETPATGAGVRTAPPLGPGDDEMSVAARWGT